MIKSTLSGHKGQPLKTANEFRAVIEKKKHDKLEGKLMLEYLTNLKTKGCISSYEVITELGMDPTELVVDIKFTPPAEYISASFMVNTFPELFI